jgi:hypothetical protein
MVGRVVFSESLVALNSTHAQMTKHR